MPDRACWCWVAAAVVLAPLVLAQKPQPDSLFRKRLALPVDILTRSRSNLVSRLGVPKDYAVCTSLDGGKCFDNTEASRGTKASTRGKSEGDLDLTVQWQHVADLQISETNQDLVDLVLGAFGDGSQSDDFQDEKLKDIVAELLQKDEFVDMLSTVAEPGKEEGGKRKKKEKANGA